MSILRVEHSMVIGSNAINNYSTQIMKAITYPVMLMLSNNFKGFPCAMNIPKPNLLQKI